jgi:hypothetical protein
VQLVFAGGTLTITGRRWTAVKPIKYEGVGRVQLDPDDDANFVTSVEVYTRTTDPTGITTATAQAVLEWETQPYPLWAIGCCGDQTYSPANSATDPAALAYALARAGIRDELIGAINLGAAVYDSTSQTWHGVAWAGCRQPDRVTVRYLAGYPLDTDGQMLDRWKHIVARLAAAELSRGICACDHSNRELYNWQYDLARSTNAAGESFQVGREELSNPFGTRRGHVEAWRSVRYDRLLRGFPQ